MWTVRQPPWRRRIDIVRTAEKQNKTLTLAANMIKCWTGPTRQRVDKEPSPAQRKKWITASTMRWTLRWISSPRLYNHGHRIASAVSWQYFADRVFVTPSTTENLPSLTCHWVVGTHLCCWRRAAERLRDVAGCLPLPSVRSTAERCLKTLRSHHDLRDRAADHWMRRFGGQHLEGFRVRCSPTVKRDEQQNP